jgi:hypothetical protein
MKRKFIISELANYEVEADSAEVTLERFLAGRKTEFPCKIKKRDVAACDPPLILDAPRPERARRAKIRRRSKRHYKDFTKMTNREWGQRIRRGLEQVRRPF